MKEFIIKYSKKPKGFFKLLYVNFLFAYTPFALLHATLALFEIVPVNFNNEKIFGIKAFIVVVVFIPFLTLVLTFFTWLFFLLGNLIIIKKIYI